MGIFNFGEVLSLSERVLRHWETAEAQIGASVNLPDGFGRGDLQDLADAFRASDTLSTQRENVREGAATLVRQRERAILSLVARFNLAVRALFPGSSYLGVLEPAPKRSLARAEKLAALERVARLWEVVNLNSSPYPGFTPPLVLVGGMTQAQMAADIEALRDAVEAADAARQDDRLARAVRRDLAAQIWARLVQYRLVAQAVMPEEIAQSLPRISPHRPPKPKPPAEPA